METKQEVFDDLIRAYHFVVMGYLNCIDVDEKEIIRISDQRAEEFKGRYKNAKD